MPLSARLSAPKQLNPCKLGSLIEEHFLKEDVDFLESVLYVPVGDATRISTQNILNAIREEGYFLGISTVERHRLKQCNCFRKSRMEK
jgi:hypothetical protein